MKSISLKTMTSAVTLLISLLTTSSAHAYLIGLALEKDQTPVTVESVGNGKQVTVSFEGILNCPTNVEFAIPDMDIPFGNLSGKLSDKEVTLGIQQDIACIREAGQKLRGTEAEQSEVKRGIVNYVFDIEKDFFGPEGRLALLNQAYAAFQTGNFSIHLLFQSYKEGDYDSSFKTVEITNLVLEKKKIIYSSASAN